MARDPDLWKTSPEYIELLNYLIEKTKDAKSPMNKWQLAKEYKGKCNVHHASQTTACVRNRIKRVCCLIHSFEHIDIHTKIKMMFALSALVTKDFMEKLKEDAIIEVDEKKRITYYKSINGEIELRGVHNPILNHDPDQWTTDPEYIELLNYLIERTKDAEFPIGIWALAKEYKGETSADQVTICARNRIKRVRMVIHSFEHIDTETKIKLLFALSAPVDADFLEKLKEDALVEVDEINRITYYKSKNGELELRGVHCKIIPEKTAQPVMNNNKSSSTAPTPEPSTNKRKADASESDSSKRIRPDESADYNPNYFIDCAPRDNNRIVERPQLRAQEDTEDVFVIPKQEILEEEEAPVQPENPIEEVIPERSQNPKIKFFQAIQSLILFLDTPSLSQLQVKIQKKIPQINESEGVFQNNEVIAVVELLIARITNHSDTNLSENVESVSLSHFLCHLKAAILNSKLMGLDSLLEKIKAINKEPTLLLKSVPVTTVAAALQTTLDIIDF